MRKQLLILSAFLVSMTVFGQKAELKAADKAIDANDFATAMSAIKKAEPLIQGADQKTTAKYYYYRALATYQNGSSAADVVEVSKAFNDLLEYEKGTKVKYSKEIQELSTKLTQSTATRASEQYNLATQSGLDADFGEAAKLFHTVYVLSPVDTAYLDNAAYVYNKAKDYNKAVELYQELLDINYTGIATIYKATSKASGQDQIFADQKSMNQQVKLGLVENPRTEVRENRQNIFYNNLASAYASLDNPDKALEVTAVGREKFPEDYSLLITEANVYFKKGNKEKFKELLEKAIAINPNDPNLYYNVGVMNMDLGDTETAIANFKKAIELNPDFASAYQNIGTAIIDKTLPIVEEMNKSLSDFEKYDKLQAQQMEIYKEAIPYYEKAYELDPTNIGVVQTLLGLYENLDMADKLEELRPVYEELKQ